MIFNNSNFRDNFEDPLIKKKYLESKDRKLGFFFSDMNVET